MDRTLHRTIAMLQVTILLNGIAVAVSAALPRTPELVAQLRWEELADGSETMAMAQIRWQRTFPML